jgi:hypothetical protein
MSDNPLETRKLDLGNAAALMALAVGVAQHVRVHRWLSPVLLRPARAVPSSEGIHIGGLGHDSHGGCRTGR